MSYMCQYTMGDDPEFMTDHWNAYAECIDARDAFDYFLSPPSCAVDGSMLRIVDMQHHTEAHTFGMIIDGEVRQAPPIAPSTRNSTDIDLIEIATFGSDWPRALVFLENADTLIELAFGALMDQMLILRTLQACGKTIQEHKIFDADLNDAELVNKTISDCGRDDATLFTYATEELCFYMIDVNRHQVSTSQIARNSAVRSVRLFQKFCWQHRPTLSDSEMLRIIRKNLRMRDLLKCQLQTPRFDL